MIDLVSLFNSASGRAVPVLINLTWQSSLLILSLWLLIKVFRMKQPQLRYYLWMFALVGTVLTLPLSLVVSRIGFGGVDLNLMSKAIMAPGDASTNKVKPTSADHYASTTVHHPSNNSLVDWRAGLPFSVWLSGALIFMARLLAAHCRIIKIRRTSQRLADREVTAALDELAGQRRSSFPFGRFGEKPVILRSDEISAPIVVGVFRPAIILPANLDDLFSASELRSILAHELAHIERCDFLVGLLQRLIQAVFFFHPLIWYVCRQMNIVCEHICDDSVVEVTDGRLDYAQALSKLVERFNGAPAALSHSPRALHSKTQTYRRIERILDHNRGTAPSPKRTAMLLPLCAVLLVMASGSRVVVEGTERREAPEEIGLSQSALQSDITSHRHRSTPTKLTFSAYSANSEDTNMARPLPSRAKDSSSKASTVEFIEARSECCGYATTKLIAVPAKTNPWDMEEFWQSGMDWRELFQ